MLELIWDNIPISSVALINSFHGVDKVTPSKKEGGSRVPFLNKWQILRYLEDHSRMLFPWKCRDKNCKTVVFVSEAFEGMKKICPFSEDGDSGIDNTLSSFRCARISLKRTTGSVGTTKEGRTQRIPVPHEGSKSPEKGVIGSELWESVVRWLR